MSSNDETKKLTDEERISKYKTEVKLATDESMADFVKECTSTEGWKVNSEKDICRVLISTTSTSRNIALRVDCKDTFKDIPPDVIWEVITQPEHFNEWDPSMIEYTVLAQLDPRTQVTYYSVEVPGPMKNRDWTLCRYESADAAAGEYIAFSSTVELSLHPPVKKFIRANCLKTGFYVCRNKEGTGSDVTYYAHNDFCGTVPVVLVNLASKTIAPNVIKSLRVASKKLWDKKRGVGVSKEEEAEAEKSMAELKKEMKEAEVADPPKNEAAAAAEEEEGDGEQDGMYFM